jgi:hypothetical protein
VFAVAVCESVSAQTHCMSVLRARLACGGGMSSGGLQIPLSRRMGSEPTSGAGLSLHVDIQTNQPRGLSVDKGEVVLPMLQQ